MHNMWTSGNAFVVLEGAASYESTKSVKNAVVERAVGAMVSAG